MRSHARGSFEVELAPLELETRTPGSLLGRMSIAKQFAGDLVGRSEGQMLTAMTEVEGSAGYVAVERVTGSLHGRKGSFSLQHSGTMARGVQQLTISVVPDSGTDELVGMTGSLMITIVDGDHSYDLDYVLP